MNTITTPRVDADLEAKHRTLWGLGDYAAIATDLVAPLGPVLVTAAGISPDQRVLDVAAGTGNTALAAASVGADVMATDLVSQLLQTGARTAAERGLKVSWRTANAEALPFADGEFDAAVSSIGIMFAPHHRQAAGELVRVCRPGGTIGVLSWTPDGFVGQMLSAMRPFVPAPPAGVSPPTYWGDEDYVRALLGDAVDSVVVTKGALRVDRFCDGAQFRDYFKANYGPTISAYRAIADDPGRTAELDTVLADLGDAALAADGRMEWEYLVVVARR
ncbi:MAG: class I SAM-dependent methyltransferase [Mycobacterium sp.]|nr:class I SAM-dependent methyltransferase [Mycobacterium sp.]